MNDADGTYAYERWDGDLKPNGNTPEQAAEHAPRFAFEYTGRKYVDPTKPVEQSKRGMTLWEWLANLGLG